MRGCRSLSEISVDQANAIYSSIDGVLFDKTTGILITYPGGKEDLNYEVPSNVTLIANDAFRSSINLSSVTFMEGGSMLAIGSGAFRNCTNLRRVEFSSNVSVIGDEAFRYCLNLTQCCDPGRCVVSGETIFFIIVRLLPECFFEGGPPSSVGDECFKYSFQIRITGKAIVKAEFAAAFGGLGNIWNWIRVEVAHSFNVLFPELDPLSDENDNGYSNFHEYAAGYSPVDDASPSTTMQLEEPEAMDDLGRAILSFTYRAQDPSIRYSLERSL